MVTKCVVNHGEPILALGKALEAKKQRIQGGILSWAVNNLPRYPWRKSGKIPYEVLIGEAWLKQTSSVVAVRVYERFIQRFLSILTLAEAEADEVADTCCKFGLQRPAQNIKVMVRCLLQEGNGDLPKSSDVFDKASGLGPCRVKCIFCFGYGMRIAIVDTNIARTLSRLFNNTLPAEPALGLLQTIDENLLPFADYQLYNSGFMELAELICRNENPLCAECPLEAVCDYAEAQSHSKHSHRVLHESVSK
jgi:A/G-specific adenine glycosylase